MCTCVCVCVEGSNWVQSLLPACLGVSQLGPVALWQPSSVLQDPTLLSLPLSLLVCKRSIVWNIDGAFAVGLARLSAGWERGGPTVGLGSRGSPHAHALQHALPWRLSCHCETPTLGCVCQQWPCALSLAVLFMGTREVARRVAGSGRGFFCNTAACILL